MTVQITGYENSTIGDLVLEGIEDWIFIIENLLKSIINGIFENGISIDWLLKDLFHINFMNLQDLNLITDDGYMQIQVTPLFTLPADLGLGTHLLSKVVSSDIFYQNPEL